MTGRLTMVVREGDREVDRREVKNLITDAGRHMVAELFSGVLQVAPKLFIAVGSGATAAAVGDTVLEAPLARAEAQPNVKTELTNVVTVVATLAASGSGEVQTLREAGIVFQLGASRPEVLYNRVTFPVISRTPTMDITLSWEVVF